MGYSVGCLVSRIFSCVPQAPWKGKCISSFPETKGRQVVCGFSYLRHDSLIYIYIYTFTTHNNFTYLWETVWYLITWAQCVMVRWGQLSYPMPHFLLLGTSTTSVFTIWNTSLVVFFFNFYFIHMCIQAWVISPLTRSPLPLTPLPPLPPLTLCYQAETILPLSLILL
jgi:hypothetical protein